MLLILQVDALLAHGGQLARLGQKHDDERHCAAGQKTKAYRRSRHELYTWSAHTSKLMHGTVLAYTGGVI